MLARCVSAHCRGSKLRNSVASETVTLVANQITPGALPFRPGIGYAWQHSLFAPVRAKLQSIVRWSGQKVNARSRVSNLCAACEVTIPVRRKSDGAQTTQAAMGFHRASCHNRCRDAPMIPDSRSIRGEQLSQPLLGSGAEPIEGIPIVGMLSWGTIGQGTFHR